MSNPFYNSGSFPATGAPATSASMRAELALIAAGFDKLPDFSGNANEFVVVNAGATGFTTTSILPAATVNDNEFTVQDNVDDTKKFQFQASAISTGTTRTITIPDVSDTLVGLTATQTLTNKTLTAPVIATIVNTGTLTLPTSTDTLVGRNTTDTLTNKTLTAPSVTTQVSAGTREVRVTMGGGVSIDVASGNYFTKTVSGSTTFTVANVPTTGTSVSFILDITNGGSAAVTWPTNTRWPNGAAPTLTTSGRDVIGFFTHDAGATWNAFVLGLAMA